LSVINRITQDRAVANIKCWAVALAIINFGELPTGLELRNF
jgi:hypothetical protein